MRKFLQDAVDLALFRIKPLDYYVYDWWVPVLWVLIVGTVPAAFATDLNTGVIERVVFFVLLIGVEALVEALFFGWWVRLDTRCTHRGSLFPLIALLNSFSLLLVLAQMLPPGLNLFAWLVVQIYGAVLEVVAISRSTGASKKHVFAAMLACVPAQFVILSLFFQVAGGLGWVDLQKWMNSDKADVTAPAKNDNNTKPTKSGEGES
jgi:hypothetical protein